MSHARILSVALLVSASVGCTAMHAGNPDDESSAANARALSTMPQLPWAGGTGDLAPWGGSDPARWRPEAVLANSMSQALNEAWARANVVDAIVAVPVKMQSSNFFEFGDGQANAAPSFEWWKESRPPIVATLIKSSDGTMTMLLKVDRALPNRDATWELQYSVGGAFKSVSLPIARTASGDGSSEWRVPTELGWDSPASMQTVLVHPKTWGDWFPIWFRFPVKSIAALKAEIPAGKATFADGGDVVDHEGISLQTHPGSGSPLDRLFAHSFSPVYNPRPYTPVDIHSRFPWNGHEYVTGVGMGWTWVADGPNVPFKIMYTCFDKRNQAAEASAPDGGVPSGGGWHRIGDPAETVLNDLEDGPIVLGSSMSNPLPSSMLPSGGFAYNLADVATIRWVKPGEAFVTPRGGSFVDPGGKTWDRANYHWYFFSQTRPVCTEEWVHPCTPTSYGFACATQSAVTFSVGNAFTNWGEDVYVVGDAKELGGWDPNAAIKLAPTSYPTWTTTISLPRSASVRFKFIRKGNGGVTWEGGGDRSFSVPNATTSSFTGSWQ
jgi:hypothetical protein